jgi:hypothetical protein
MRPTLKTTLAALIALATIGAAQAQESASFRLKEHVLNAGGSPAGGATPGSASYRVSLDALGEGVLPRPMSSASFRLDGGFGAAYPPPGEVTGLRFLDETTLAWNPERSVGLYNLYRDLLGALSGSSAGACEQQGLAGETATDSDAVPVGDGYFYLVTAENRLGEEGTRGADSAGASRPTTGACP